MAAGFLKPGKCALSSISLCDSSPSVLVTQLLAYLCALLDWRIVRLVFKKKTRQESRGGDAALTANCFVGEDWEEKGFCARLIQEMCLERQPEIDQYLVFPNQETLGCSTSSLQFHVGETCGLYS